MERSPSDLLDSFTERIARRRLHASQDSQSPSPCLEEDLRLSAELGQALLAENAELKDRLAQGDVARDQLLDRLAGSYRDQASLEKKCERQQNALDSAEGSNRVLLAALEQDRKSISRLSTERLRLANADKRLSACLRERDDLKQEVDVLNKRVRAADSKAARATQRLTDHEEKRAMESNMSPSASPSKPTRSSSTIILNQPDAAEHQELHHLAESLTEQNSVLRAQVNEVQSLLDASQNETARLQSELDDAQPHVQQIDHSLADEVFSASSSRQPSPALQQNPQWDAVSEPDSVSSMSYNRPDGSSKPAFGHMHARRRKSGGPSAAAVASMFNANPTTTGSSNNRPKSFSLPRPSLINRRTNSVDMGNIYSFKAADDSHRAPLESIADTSPAVSRAASKEPLPEPVSPTGSRTFNSTTVSPAPHLLTTCEAAVQTDAEPPQASSSVPFLHSPVPSTSSESRLPFFSSTSHKPSSSVTSDSLSEQDKFFISSAHHHPTSPAEHLSPDGNYLSATPSTSHMDLRTTALPSLLDASTKLLMRVRNANLASLEARLKKQHLPGDVAHLAKSTVKDILKEIDGLRDGFRRIVEQERRQMAASTAPDQSLVTRRDFVQLVKLLREMLGELSRLRSILNRVQLDPTLATKIGEMDDMEAYEEAPPASSDAAAASAASPAGSGLLAPLSRLLFSQPTVSSPAEDKMLRRKASARPGPKLTALRSVAAENVNVEFGSGSVKQAAVIARARGGRDDASTPDARSGLRHIFAGSHTRPTGIAREDRDNGWVGLAGPPDRQRASRPLSSHMDAVLDNFAGQQQHHHQHEEHPKLLERTLRPRGLSDSSIHSTFTAHGAAGGAGPSHVTASRLAATAVIDDDDLAATLEDTAERSQPIPTASAAATRPSAELASSMHMGGASMFGEWSRWSAGRPMSMMDRQHSAAQRF